MTMLITAAAVFLGIHLLIAGTKLRDALTSLIGENVYLGLFSLASIGVIVWLVMSYNLAGATRGSSTDPMLYDLGPGVRHLGIPVIAIAFLLGVPGLLIPNPASVKQESFAAKSETVKGVLRITRHPFLWGVAIWSAFHTSANGDEASVIFFGTFLLLALCGTLSIDAKCRRKLGEAWAAFAAKTSSIPFAAIVSGRNSFRAREYFDWRFFAAIVLFAAILLAHAHLFGVSPFPGGYVPF